MLLQLNEEAPVEMLCVANVVPDLARGGVQELVATFVELSGRLGVRNTVISLGAPRDDLLHRRILAAGAAFVELPARKVLDPARLLRLAAFLRRRRHDVVHAHLSAANTVAPLAGRLAGTPVFGGLHLAGQGAPRRRSLPEAAALRWLARGAIACGPEVAREGRARLGRLPVWTLANPVPRGVCAEPPPAARRGPPISAPVFAPVSAPVFAVVGRLAPEKRVDHVLEAAAAARDAGAAFSLAVVGEGPCRADLEATCARLELGGHVRFTGLVDDVPAVLAASDAYLSASAVEGMSLALLQAMAAGLPAVVTAAGDAPALVDASVGALVAVGDRRALAAAMLDVCRDPAGWRARGEAGRRRVLADHDAADWASSLVAAYRQAARR